MILRVIFDINPDYYNGKADKKQAFSQNVYIFRKKTQPDKRNFRKPLAIFMEIIYNGIKEIFVSERRLSL